MPGDFGIMHNGLNNVNVVLVDAHHFCLLLFDLSIMQNSLTRGRHMHSHLLMPGAWRGEDTVYSCSMLRVEIHGDLVTIRMRSNR